MPYDKALKLIAVEQSLSLTNTERCLCWAVKVLRPFSLFPFLNNLNNWCSFSLFRLFDVLSWRFWKHFWFMCDLYKKVLATAIKKVFLQLLTHFTRHFFRMHLMFVSKFCLILLHPRPIQSTIGRIQALFHYSNCFSNLVTTWNTCNAAQNTCSVHNTVTILWSSWIHISCSSYCLSKNYLDLFWVNSQSLRTNKCAFV